MARIPEAEIERLKMEISVERLVASAGIELKHAGKDLLGRCPFHEDDTASLVVTPAKNLWHCFGCGIGGGPIDWVMKKNGVSFRHAVELLREGLPSLAAQPATGAAEPVKHSTVRTLAAAVAFDADDAEALRQVADYYHLTLKASPEALEYLQARGIDHPEVIDRFKLGYANRTLGLRLPDKRRKAGAEVRARLERLGVMRETSGHEHLAGSLVIPILDEEAQVQNLYGRKIGDKLRAGTPKHLYLPRPHAGVWNVEALQACEEVILCEALIDALTFWSAGYRNVTAAYGVEGFTPDHLEAFRKYGIKRVLIAFDRDEAGDRGAEKVAAQLMAEGFECWRILFPKGMDANEYALKLTPAAKSLGIAIRKAQWLGKGAAPAAPLAVREASPSHAAPTPPTKGADSEAPEAPAPEAEPEPAETMAPASPVAPSPTETAAPEVSEDTVRFAFGERRYRVRGWQKNLGVEVMKINLLAARNDAFHVDTFDLYSARARANFVTQAALELQLRDEVVKGDLGRVLLKLEELQEAERDKTLTPVEAKTQDIGLEDTEAALALLRSPDLLARILADFESAGLVGEATNKLAAYLAVVSRKLEGRLAIVVQSSSAAGKSTLMDAVLAFVPEEDRVKYSAMTGQSLFYMGETNLKHKMLAIARKKARAAPPTRLKLLQSEGELTIASTGKDPQTGNLVTQQYRVEGPVMIFLTTTAIEIDEELLNRCIVLSVDESREQTEAIHRRQREKRTLAGLAARAEREEVRRLHCNAQRLLKPLAVVNPYADRLTFLSDKTRTRRDHEKYLTLIDTIALLHQYQRPIKTMTHRGHTVEYLEVALEDIAAANRLTHEVLGRSLDELPPQTRRLLGAVAGYVQREAAARSLRLADFRFTRKEVRDVTGWGDTQLKVHLARLVEMEYLLVHRAERGQGYVFELLYDGAGTEAPHLSGLIDMAALRYDAERSGASSERPAPGRAAAGREPAPGRVAVLPANPIAVRLPEELADAVAVPAHLKANGETAPYRQSRVA